MVSKQCPFTGWLIANSLLGTWCVCHNNNTNRLMDFFWLFQGSELSQKPEDDQIQEVWILNDDSRERHYMIHVQTLTSHMQFPVDVQGTTNATIGHKAQASNEQESPRRHYRKQHRKSKQLLYLPKGDFSFDADQQQ